MKRLLLFFFVFFGTVFGNSVDKAYYHQGKKSDQLVCYMLQPFTYAVSDKMVNRNGSQRVRRTYVVDAKISPQQIASLKGRLNRPLTSVSVHSNKAGKTIITVEFDPKRTSVSAHRFVSIKNSPGFSVMCSHNQNMKYAKDDTPLIVIDPGHGGSDDGAWGLGSRPEKELALEIASRVVHILKERGYRVAVTRSDDRFVPLDRRTSLSNNHNADVFVSLHINSAPSNKAQGIETYSCSHRLFAPQLSQGAYKDQESAKLALDLQGSIMQRVTNHQIRDRKTKKSVSQVLMGTEMPSALVELGFCSHPEEVKLLHTPSYQQLLAQGVANGIAQYLHRS